MINEKMLEFLVLQEIIKQNKLKFHNKTIEFEGKKYDYDKIKQRYKKLASEFLEPYVIWTTWEGIKIIAVIDVLILTLY